MTRIEILNIINEIIEEEHGNKLEEDQLLTECGIDSFGYAMLWLGLVAKVQERTGITVLSKDELKQISYDGLTVKNVIDMVESKLCM
jgi:acyl carrier protein